MSTTLEDLEILLRDEGITVRKLEDRTLDDEGVCFVLNDSYELSDPGEQFFVVAAVPEYGEIDAYIRVVWKALDDMPNGDEETVGFEPLSFTSNYSSIPIPGRSGMQKADIAVFEVSSNVRL